MQQKEYTLRTLHHGRPSILAISDEHVLPHILYLTDVTFVWLRHNFPHQHFGRTPPDDALNRFYPAEC